jgi:glutaconate CoA-transferase, subunit B
VLVYESGTIGSKPATLPLSIGDGELAETADAVVPVPEIFNYWLQGGRIDVGFLGAAQIDRHANLNSTVIGTTTVRRFACRAAEARRRSRRWRGRSS